MIVQEINFWKAYQKKTQRNYIERVTSSRQSGMWRPSPSNGARNYWDGERQYGYAAINMMGRWLPIAKDIAQALQPEGGRQNPRYRLRQRLLLHELTQAVPAWK